MQGVKVRDDIKLNEVSIGGKIYDINQGMQVKEFCKEYGLSSNGGVAIDTPYKYTDGDDDKYRFDTWFTFNCQPIFKEEPNSFKVKQGIDYTYTLYSKDGEVSEETETIHNALSLETAKKKDDSGKKEYILRDNEEDPIRAIATTVPVRVSLLETQDTLGNTAEQGVYEELHTMMNAQLQVVFAGGVTAGQTKEEIDAYLGKGLEYKFQIDQEPHNDNYEPDDYLFSYYKSNDATLVIAYALDKGIDFTKHGSSPEKTTIKTSYTKNNGYYAKNVMLFRNEQF